MLRLAAKSNRVAQGFMQRYAGDYGVDEEDDDGLDWTASPLFVIASSHAITVSKLVRSFLAPEGIVDTDAANGGGRQVVKRAPPEIVKSLTVLWPAMVLRAAWIHVLCIRKFRKIQASLGDAANGLLFGGNGPVVSPEFLESLLDDVQACLNSINEIAGAAPKSLLQPAPQPEGTVSPVLLQPNSAVAPRTIRASGRDPWRYARLVYGVMLKLLNLDVNEGQGTPGRRRGSLSLTEEEIAELSLIKDVSQP